MMTSQDLLSLISQGETTTVQFKVRTEDGYKTGVEMVAFSNSQGGRLIVGVNDKNGSLSGLSFEELQATNALLSNAASENVKPSIVISTQTVDIGGQHIIVATIPQGKDKPYKDNKGIIWVKNGSDKRKVFSNSELRVMLQSCGNLIADKDSIDETSINDIAEPVLKTFLYMRYTKECEAAGISVNTLQTSNIENIVKAIDINFTLEKLLQNISLMDSKGQLTLSGLLLLGQSIQRYKPVFTIKCISFVGNSLATTAYRDKMPDSEMEGNLQHQYKAAISFINRNLKSIQVEKEFNSLPRLEIPLEVFVETLTNALIHRDYYQNAPIRLFIFDDRVEIISPGILPDSVTEESIRQGISKPRNQLLFENSKYLLPYTGIGSGIVRALKSYKRLTFKNDYIREEFIITAERSKELPDVYVYPAQISDSYKYNNLGNDVYDGAHDGVYDSVHDGVYDDTYTNENESVLNKSNNEKDRFKEYNYDEKILLFTLLPKSRKDIMNLLKISPHPNNYARHIVPLLQKGFLTMTLPDKPKSKNQKYVTTNKGKKVIHKK
ncbi:MAG: putative DNA binding domain-containing protein [Tannerella sp.]|jgi:predicted HTH transcriptional regulator|nr:putative DNA binding domain-containing protein [Tannerella sp.]